MINLIKKYFASTSFSVTDHCDGKKFFTEPRTPQKSLLAVIKLIFSKNNTRWPKFVTIPRKEFSPSIDANIILTYINHSTFLIQSNKLAILTDPIFSQCAGPLGKIGPQRVRAPGIALVELPKINVVLISHNHYDHMDIPALIKLNKIHNPLFIVPLGNKCYLEKNNITNVMEMDWWQSYSYNEAQTITLVPAQHWSRRSLLDTNCALWGGFWIKINEHKIYFAGDTGYSDHFKKIHQQLGAPDVSLLPIGSYMPQWFMRASHISPEEAIWAHKDLHSKLSIAMHHRTFKLSHEGIDVPAEELVKQLQLQNLNAQDFRIFENGESLICKVDNLT